MRFISCLLLGLLILSSFGFAVDVQTNAFYGQAASISFNITPEQNITYYFPFQKYNYLKNFTMVLNGAENSSCYQENAEIANDCSKSIGNYKGSNFDSTAHFGIYFYDDDWATYTYASVLFSGAHMYVNYSVPHGAIGAKWIIKDSNGTHEFSVYNCTTSDNLIRLNITLMPGEGTTQRYACYNGSSETVLSSYVSIADFFSIYDDAINWTFRAPSNISISSNNLILSNNSGYIIGAKNITLNSSHINDILSTSCICTNCSIVGNACKVPITFHSDSNGILNITANATSSYDFNACTGSSIPGNASMLNYTGKYEANQSLVNIDATTGSYLTWNLHGESTTSTIYPSISNQNSFGYCGYPNWATFDLDYSINYNPTSSPLNVRQRAADGLLLNNVISTIPLYVSTSDSTGIIRVKIIDGFQNPIQGANVIAQRTISGTTYTVQTAVSDSVGMTYLSLDTLQQYTITASKTGYSSTSMTIIPTTTDIYSLTLGGQSSQNASCISGVSYAFLPSTFELSNLTDYMFHFNMTSSQCDVTACSMSIYTGSSLADSLAGVYNASSCGANVLFNTVNYTNITVIGSYTLDGVSYSNQKTYYPTDWNPGEYTMLTIFNDINNFSGAGFDWRSKMLITFLIIFMITGVASWKFNSLINPEAAIILQFGLVLLFSIGGWLTIPSYVLSFPTIGTTNLGQYAIMFLDGIASAAFLIWRLS